MIDMAYAMGVQPGQAGGDGIQSLVQFLPIILIFVVFYFLLIRPQQQKQKELKASLSALKRGDKVVTGGGIIGTISKPPETDNREIEVEIAAGVKVLVMRETITGVVAPKAANDSKAADKK